MVIDAIGPTFPPVHVSHEPNENETGISSSDQGESFSDVISAADQPLYSESENHSQLSAVARLVNIKSEYNLPQSCYEEISQLIEELLPRDHTLPKDYYSTKKLIRELGLPVEKIFPPAFFDSMEHLLVHLPYEARVGGPVQYRWMFLCNLKKKVKNKAAVEASICEAYIVEEISIFTTHYFEPDVICKKRRPGRNDDGLNNENIEHMSIFNHPGRPHGASKMRYLIGEERHVAETYIVANCPEAHPYYEWVDPIKGVEIHPKYHLVKNLLLTILMKKKIVFEDYETNDDDDDEALGQDEDDEDDDDY
ncbi:UNVERIFIED_CONTAM: hypothetical protein Sradi_3273600 [Sesamum radiatum]|uniref:DUF4218 domain-containing protein n=1 Tax=Sesamum radiatum TaxID=300843 RepID=A0AAW2R175_SESRA